ncbi:MAG: acyl CoA:acetate/3-ketoacid CoA transferase [Candidatus Omnitrophica bacterium]|nr:acyl CoA:acetate/3-ketoacid CoA transferase [Candidatus Omnitrophota bacterium]
MRHIITADEAIRLIPDGATVAVNPIPIEEVFSGFDRVFEETGHPKDLTVIWSAGLGPMSEERRGMNHFAHPGMVRRLIGGHFGLNYKLVQMVAQNECEAYNLPQGAISQLYREIASGRPGLVTRTGLGTFVDPRLEGGKMNERTQTREDLVEVVQLGGREHLFYRSIPLHFGIVRGTTADPSGNLTGEDEAITMENFELAMAVKNSGGTVIAQVEKISEVPAVPQMVTVPGNLVDYIVVATCRHQHPHTLFVEHDPSFSGRERVSLEDEIAPLPLNSEKVICRRAAMEIEPGMNVNLGFGIPMGVSNVAFEEGFLGSINLSTELGSIGGLPERGKNFGPAKNPSAFISQTQMFDFYDGGGLDITCVGLAQVDREGNVNVSKLGPRVIGCGGFINITQAAKKVVFCGEFTAVGLETEIGEGRLTIRQEGKAAKFIEKVQQITFSGKQARESGRPILYVTERCVFELVEEGLLLREVAPGIDIERDILGRMEFRPTLPDEIKTMDSRIYLESARRLTAPI